MFAISINFTMLIYRCIPLAESVCRSVGRSVGGSACGDTQRNITRTHAGTHKFHDKMLILFQDLSGERFIRLFSQHCRRFFSLCSLAFGRHNAWLGLGLVWSGLADVFLFDFFSFVFFISFFPFGWRTHNSHTFKNDCFPDLQNAIVITFIQEYT